MLVGVPSLMPQNLPIRISAGKWVHDSLSSQAAFPFQEQEIWFVHSVRPCAESSIVEMLFL